MRCVHPTCQSSARSRGLCHGHYQTMRSYVRAGKADEADLERRGLMTPKGTGGTPAGAHHVFLLGSEVIGCGLKLYR